MPRWQYSIHSGTQNFYLIKNVEDIVVFLDLKVFNSDLLN